ncbi:MAG: hypothetical protein ABI904_00755 [Chloroflexota bacterium]
MANIATVLGSRQYMPMFPGFLDMKVDETHLEMASLEFAELEIIKEIVQVKKVAVDIIGVKSYYIETPEDIAERVRRCLKYAPANDFSLRPNAV